MHQNLTPEQPKKPISNIQADDAKSYETLQAKVKMDDLYTDMVSEDFIIQAQLASTDCVEK